jgi:heat shock protein HslJ
MTRSRTPFQVAVLAAAVALLAAACGDDNSAPADTDASPDGPSVLAIDGATYLSETVTGYTLVDGSVLRLSFDGDRLSADAGCNTMGGGFSVTDGKIVLDGPMMQTEMFCDGLMDQESWFAELLAASPAITQDGDRITLATDDVTLVMLDREIADPDRPIEGTAWEVTSLINADAVSSVPEGASILLEDGTASVQTGCNSGSGTYEVSEDGTSVTFGPIAITKMACMDEQVTELEAAVLAVLDGTATVEIEAGSLTLTNGDAGLGFTAAE